MPLIKEVGGVKKPKVAPWSKRTAVDRRRRCHDRRRQCCCRLPFADRRNNKDRRTGVERRGGWLQINRWQSVGVFRI
jgi:hypothetical protein